MPETLFIGRKSLWLNETFSTNDYLSNWAETEYLPEGTTVAALHQNSGRGQRGTSWHSKPGENLLVSVLFKPTFIPVQQQFNLSKAVALAVHELISKELPEQEVKIKWPNDIYVNGQKIAGILIENTLQQQYIKTSVVGIGINVNQEEFALPKATSLKLQKGVEFNLKEVLSRLCVFLEKRYLQLLRGDQQKIHEAYIGQLFGLNRLRTFTIAATGEAVEGIITGISPEGKLQLHIGNEPKFFDLKEIIFL